jgi:hypothetical protein
MSSRVCISVADVDSVHYGTSIWGEWVAIHAGLDSIQLSGTPDELVALANRILDAVTPHLQDVDG